MYTLTERLAWTVIYICNLAFAFIIFGVFYAITLGAYETPYRLHEHRDLYINISRVVGFCGATIFYQSFIVALGGLRDFFRTWVWKLISYTRGAVILGCSTILYVIGEGDGLAFAQIRNFDLAVFFEQMYLMTITKSKLIYSAYLLVMLGLYLRKVHFDQDETRDDLVTLSWWCFCIAYGFIFVLVLISL